MITKDSQFPKLNIYRAPSRLHATGLLMISTTILLIFTANSFSHQDDDLTWYGWNIKERSSMETNDTDACGITGHLRPTCGPAKKWSKWSFINDPIRTHPHNLAALFSCLSQKHSKLFIFHCIRAHNGRDPVEQNIRACFIGLSRKRSRNFHSLRAGPCAEFLNRKIVVLRNLRASVPPLDERKSHESC